MGVNNEQVAGRYADSKADWRIGSSFDVSIPHYVYCLFPGAVYRDMTSFPFAPGEVDGQAQILTSMSSFLKSLHPLISIEPLPLTSTTIATTEERP